MVIIYTDFLFISFAHIFVNKEWWTILYAVHSLIIASGIGMASIGALNTHSSVPQNMSCCHPLQSTMGSHSSGIGMASLYRCLLVKYA